ncbi:MAG: hypothetical protein U5R46_08760 [Gammaproteobacteria bacterium]|nr:hypothetical protein [Gammaproteobacteria bacterium]
MEKTSVIVVAGLVIVAIYIALKTFGAIRRVGFLNFSKASVTLLAALAAAGLKVAGGILQGRSQQGPTVGSNPDPFLSPMEKSPAAQSPLIENPIDNPEGYYRGD